MDFIGLIANRLAWEFKMIIEWAVRNWGFTMLALGLLIYWIGRQGMFNRRHF